MKLSKQMYWKQIFSTFLFIAFVYSIQAQRAIVWFDTGLKVQYGGTSLLNQAIVDQSDIKYALASGTKIGGKVGVNFGNSGLALDLMFNSAKSKFNLGGSDDQSVIRLKSIDLYTLYRNEGIRSYFEFGPMFSFGHSGSRIDIVNGVSQTSVSLEKQLKNSIAAVLGFGMNIIGNDGGFSGKLGFRIEYGFTDVISEVGQESAAPLHRPDIYLDGYKGSHPIFAGIVFELNWGIGYYGQSQCGGRAKFFSW